jgi:hypothetical protein
MSLQAAIARLSGIALILACGRQAAPAPRAELRRNPDCADSLAQRDSGMALSNDVRRGPRYRVDSAGRLETLPPIPAVGGDTTRPDCRSPSDTSSTHRQP